MDADIGYIHFSSQVTCFWTFPSCVITNLVKNKLPEVWKTHLYKCTESLEQISVP